MLDFLSDAKALFAPGTPLFIPKYKGDDASPGISWTKPNFTLNLLHGRLPANPYSLPDTKGGNPLSGTETSTYPES